MECSRRRDIAAARGDITGGDGPALAARVALTVVRVYSRERLSETPANLANGE